MSRKYLSRVIICYRHSTLVFHNFQVIGKGALVLLINELFLAFEKKKTNKKPEVLKKSFHKR